jgi:hypothetical protein
MPKASMPKTLAGAGLTALLVALTASTAAAGRRHRHPAQLGMDDAAYSWITVNSNYGTAPGTISAPVRPGRFGYEVRLPGGVWVPCTTNCYDTLRHQTVDFWQRYD